MLNEEPFFFLVAVFVAGGKGEGDFVLACVGLGEGIFFPSFFDATRYLLPFFLFGRLEGSEATAEASTPAREWRGIFDRPFPFPFPFLSFSGLGYSPRMSRVGGDRGIVGGT